VSKPRDRAVDEGMWRDAQPWKRPDALQADDELASPAWARFDGLTPLALIACLTIGLARPLQDNVPRKIHPSSLSLCDANDNACVESTRFLVSTGQFCDASMFSGDIDSLSTISFSLL